MDAARAPLRTWMSVRRGPTERDRSEGTLTKEGPNQEQAPLVTWGAFPSNSPQAKCSAVRQRPLILVSMLEITGVVDHAHRCTRCVSGTCFSREASGLLNALVIFIRSKSSHHKSRLGCRLNAGLVQWAEPHGCGESAVRTGMSVRRGPTERDRSEGTLTKEGPNREQALLVTFSAF